MGSNSKVKKVKKRSINSKLENLSIYAIFWCKYPFDTPGVAKYGFISTFYFLVCLSRAIFKDFIGGQTRVSKKVKKEVNQLKVGTFTYGVGYTSPDSLTFMLLHGLSVVRARDLASFVRNKTILNVRSHRCSTTSSVTQLPNSTDQAPD